MPLYPTILCAVDFSEHARRALRAALMFGARTGSRVVAVHVVDQMLAEAARSIAEAPPLRSEVESELRSFVQAEQDTLVQSVDCIVRIGKPEREILACARDASADLIVLGTQGLGGIRKWFFGSIAEKVLRDAQVPVLAVPLGGDAAGSPRRIVASVDLEDDRVARAAVALGGELSLPVSLVRVVRPVDAAAGSAAAAAEESTRQRVSDARTALSALAARLGDSSIQEIEVRAGSPAEQIAALADAPGSLIVIGSGSTADHRRPGSTAYRVLSLSAAPVLAIPI